MKANHARIRDLVDLTEMAWQAKQAELKSIRRREQVVRAALEALDHRMRTAFRPEEECGDTALLAQADMNWQRWTERERARLNTDLARILAEAADAKARIKQTFGRHQVMQKLVGKLDQI